MKRIINEMSTKDQSEQDLQLRKEFELKINIDNLLHLESVISELREELKKYKSENSQLKQENEELKKMLQSKNEYNSVNKTCSKSSISKNCINIDDEDEQFEKDEYFAKLYEESLLNDNRELFISPFPKRNHIEQRVSLDLHQFNQTQSDKRIERSNALSLDDRIKTKYNQRSFNESTPENKTSAIPTTNMNRRFTSKLLIEYKNNSSVSMNLINKPNIKEVNIHFADQQKSDAKRDESLNGYSLQDKKDQQCPQIYSKKYNHTKNKIFNETEASYKKKECSLEQRSKIDHHKKLSTKKIISPNRMTIGVSNSSHSSSTCLIKANSRNLCSVNGKLTSDDNSIQNIPNTHIYASRSTIKNINDGKERKISRSPVGLFNKKYMTKQIFTKLTSDELGSKFTIIK